MPMSIKLLCMTKGFIDNLDYMFCNEICFDEMPI